MPWIEITFFSRGLKFGTLEGRFGTLESRFSSSESFQNLTGYRISILDSSASASPTFCSPVFDSVVFGSFVLLCSPLHVADDAATEV